jgi:hypothetical protein
MLRVQRLNVCKSQTFAMTLSTRASISATDSPPGHLRYACSKKFDINDTKDLTRPPRWTNLGLSP